MQKLSLKRSENLQDKVANLLEKKILKGDWPVGSKIPTEPELCKSMNISRTILREAIAKLKSKEFVESRQGSGVFVIRNKTVPTLRIENENLKNIEILRELMELRFSIEINAAHLAALRRTQTQIKALQKAHNALCKAVENNKLGVTEDLKFHEAITAAANNSHYRQLLQFLGDQVATTVKAARSRSIKIKGYPQQVISEHKNLLDAIIAGDAQEARAAAWTHQINAAKRMGIRGLLAWESLRLSHLQKPRHIPHTSILDKTEHPHQPLPANTCDTHVTLLGDNAKYPMLPNRSYTPNQLADFAAYKKFQDSFGIKRAVFIQASVYGRDHSLLLDSLRQSGNENYRGVALVDSNTPEPLLNEMHRLGVRGIRVNTLFQNGIELQNLTEVSQLAHRLGWHVDLQADVSEFSDFYGEVSGLKAPLVVDHMGHIPSDIGVNSKGFQDVLRLLDEGKIWVRLAGFCRLTTHEKLPFDDIKPYVEALVDARPDRLLWGSDWPHPAVDFIPPSAADLFLQVSQWIGDKDLLNQICTENPLRLYWNNEE